MALEAAAPTIWVPRYASPRNPDGMIPPSPPSESRHRDWRAFLRDHVTYSGAVCLPGVNEGRVWRPRWSLADLTRWFAARGPCASMFGMQVRGSIAAALTAPTAFYRLDGLNDTSGNALNLTNSGGVTFGAGGQIGDCATFGTGNFLSHADTASLRGGVGVSISACGWVYTATTPSAAWSALSKDGGGDRGYLIQGSSHSGGQPYDMFVRLYGTSDGSTFATLPISASISLSAWHFWLMTFDPSRGANNRIGVAFDGSALTYGTSSDDNITSIAAATGDFRLGAYFNGAGQANWPGSLDASGFWHNYVLTTPEAAALWNGGAGKEFSGAWH